jgi:hypothetical protein
MLISVFAFVVKRGWRAVSVVNRRRSLLSGGGLDEGVASHFLLPWTTVATVAADRADDSISSEALSLRFDGRSISSR